MVSGMEIAQGDIVAVVRGAAEGQIRDRHPTQAADVNVGKCWMRLKMLYESHDARQGHLTLVNRRNGTCRRYGGVALSHSQCSDRLAG